MIKNKLTAENKKLFGWNTKIGDLLELPNSDILTPKLSQDTPSMQTCGNCYCIKNGYKYCTLLACTAKQRTDKQAVYYELVKPVIIKYSAFLILRIGKSEIIFNGINYSLMLKTSNEMIRRTSERIETVINTFRFYTNTHINDNTIKKFREIQDSIDFK